MYVSDSMRNTCATWKGYATFHADDAHDSQSSLQRQLLLRQTAQAKFARVAAEANFSEPRTSVTAIADESSPDQCYARARTSPFGVYQLSPHERRIRRARLIDDLAQAGYPSWTDTEAIKGDDEWINTIVTGLNNSYALIVIVSTENRYWSRGLPEDYSCERRRARTSDFPVSPNPTSNLLPNPAQLSPG